MQVDISQKHLKPVLIFFLIFCFFPCGAQHIPIPNAFAHNDYWHKRPLYDALNNGYIHIEADIYLRKGKLIVAHILPLFKRKKTLEQLYLKPMLETINGTSKEISCPVSAITLMIDIKSDADKTYLNLCKLLDQYKDILTNYDNGKVTTRQVTVVLTGHKPYQLLSGQTKRFAFIDEDLMRSRHDTVSPGLYQTASCKYSDMMKWDGSGQLPEKDRQRLLKYVAIAHRYQKKVRLWASPEREEVWRVLLDCGVDLINTDKLPELKNFLLLEQKSYAQSNNR